MISKKNEIKNKSNKNNPTSKMGILVVSFGTSHEGTRRSTIEAIKKKISEEFKGYKIYIAFTSSIIRKILKKRDNIIIPSTQDALDKMNEANIIEVIIQPLHFLPGEEFHEKILKIVNGYKENFKRIIVGKPIFSNLEDYDLVINALKKQLPKLKDEQAVILMGHGSQHPANACYSCLQLKLMENIKNVFVATIEGYPTLDSILPKLKDSKIREITLVPLMVVAGEHVLNDMAGDQKDSWKKILEKEGYSINIYLKGLGENSAFQDIYIQHIKNAIKNSKN